MKILIVSDSHGRDRHVAMALDREWPVDAMIHLGDSQEDEDEFSMILAGEDVPLYMVRGNCDYDYNLAPFRIVELEGHRILMTHGHMQSAVLTGSLLILRLKITVVSRSTGTPTGLRSMRTLRGC